MRVLGVDPGLTRCGVGIVEGAIGSPISLVGVGVILTPTDAALDQRLLDLDQQLSEWINLWKPDVIAVERVFSQHNVRTVMGTGQAAGIALLLAAKAGVLDEVSRITAAAMRGELDFAQSLIARVALLQGLSEDVIMQVQREITLTDGAAELVTTLHQRGHCVSLVSGGSAHSG